MKIGGTTYSKKDLSPQIDKLKRIGYDFAEIDLPFEISDKFKKDVEENKSFILSAHLPDINFEEGEIENYKEYIRFLSSQNINLFVTHLLSRDLPTENNLEFKIKCLKEITDFSEENSSILVLENTEENIKTLKKVFNKIPNLKFCLDVGHANLFSEKNCSIELIEEFQDILFNVHIHDNIGGYEEMFDLHFPVGVGKINFDSILKKLKEIKYPNSIVLEIFNIEEKYEKMGLKKFELFF